MKKRSASGFQESNKELEMLFENSFDALLLTGENGKIYRANSAAEELFGYSAEELYGLGRTGLADMTDPEWPKAVEERDRTGKFTGILRCRKKDGTLFYCEVASRFFRNEEGSILASTSVRDVTHRIESEKELRTLHKQMQDIIDSSPAIVFAKDLEGRFIIVNRRLEEFFGMTNEELKGKTDYDLFPKEWAEYYREQDRETLKYGKAIDVVEEADLPGRARRYYLLNKFPLLDENARPYAICGIASDITEQKNAEDILRRERELFEGIFDSIPVMVTTYDPKLKTFRFNKELKKRLGWTEEDTLDGNFMERVYPDPALRKEVSDYMKSLEPGWREFLITAKDGSQFESSWSNVWLADNTHIGIGLDVSKIKETERQLRESRKGLIEAQRLAHIGNWHWDIKSDALSGSDEILRIYGLDPAKDKVPALEEQKKFFSPENFEIISNSVQKALETGEGYELDVEIMRNGSKAWITNRVEPVKDEMGRVIALSGTIQDLTERKLIEQQFELQGRLLETIVLNIPTGIAFIRGSDLVFELVNDAYQAIVPGRIITGRKIEEVLPEAFTALKDEIRKVLETGVPYHAFDAVFASRRSTDGLQEERCFNYSLIRIHLPGKDEWGILNTVIETTDYVKANRSVIDSEAKLREAQKLAHMGSFTFEAATGMLDWMDEVFNIFERDPAKGHPSFQDVLNYVHPEDREYVSACLEEAQKYKKTLYMEYRIITDKGNVKYLRYIGNPIFDSNGNLIRRFGTVLDITESKTAELKLKTTLQNLERSNSELEQFAYIASHDLQEPLRMVSNFARLIAQRYQNHLDERANEYISFMVDGTKRMQTLISDLLQYARVTTKAQPFVTTDMNQIMDYVTADLRMAIDEKNAYLNYEKLPEINADPIQMRQLMQNLVANAIKFKGSKDPEICIEASKNELQWIFSVKDNGIGIAPEYHERIFVIFQRLHEREKYAGTGIGLALCKKIVERHGGRIWVESEEGQGSAFYFTIPFVTAQY